MQCKWLGERVAAPSLRLVVKNAITQTVAPSWGPNATFRFPNRGGTGGIWKAVAGMLPKEELRFGQKASIKAIHLDEKYVTMENGQKVGYKHLVSTMAVDHLLNMSVGDGVDDMKKHAEGLKFSSTIVLGVGIRGQRPERIGDKCE